MATQQYTIGRSTDCTIYIADESKRISRNHATLTVVNNSKIYITDHSTNGTFVNGVKVAPGSEYPIQRGDTVSFANVADLDWSLVPKGKGKKVMLIILIALIVIGCGVGGYFYFNTQNKSTTLPGSSQENSLNIEQDKREKEKIEKITDKLTKEEAQKRAEIRRKAAELEEAKAKAKAKAEEAKAKAKEQKTKAEAEAKKKNPTFVF